MTIYELKELGTGTEVENLEATIETSKKGIELSKDRWQHKAVLTDGQASLLAVFPESPYNPLQRNAEVLVSGVVESVDGKAYGGMQLRVKEWKYNYTAMSEPPEPEDDWANHLNIQTRGKVKCLYIARLLGRTDSPSGNGAVRKALEAAKCPEMKELIDETMKG